jgi:hypothetical protein
VKRSKYFSFTSALAMAVCSLQAVGQQLPTLSISTVPSTLTVGQSFVVDVDISNVADLYGWQLDLNFTPGVVAAGNATEGSFLASGGHDLRR